MEEEQLEINVEKIGKEQKNLKKVPEYLSEEYGSKFGRLLTLTKEQESRLKKRLKREIDDWKSNTADLHKSLQEDNDLIENVVEETDYPWTGASNIHIPISAIYMKVYHSIERRSILGSDLIWYVEIEDENIESFAADIDEGLNYKARNEWNIEEALNDVFWTTPRDGLGIMQVPYVEEYEKVNDVVYISSIEEFMQEFPTMEDTGLSEEEFSELIQRIVSEADEYNPVPVPITYEKVVYSGPKGEVVELVDFVTFPATAKDITRQYARGYGKRFTLRRGEIKRRKKDGLWYEKAVDTFLNHTKSGSNANSYTTSRDRIEGLNRSGRSDDYEFFELVYYFDLDKGKEEVKLLLTYSHDEDELTAVIEYPYRVDFYALFRIESRPNRLIGNSIPRQARDLNNEIDTQHNQRIHTREISTVPSFKGQKTAKTDIDFEAEENQFRPGVIFWMAEPDKFEQFKIQPTDLGESIQEESNDVRYCSLLFGVDAFISSGLAQQNDPDAPGNKTMALINQSNLRMDDPISELRSGVEKVGEICLSHVYQFGSSIFDFSAEDESGKMVRKQIPKRILRKGIKIRMQGITVAQNPEAEFMRWYNYYKALVAEPVIGQSPKRRIEILKRALNAGRVRGRNKILPTMQELEQEEIQMRIKVQQTMQAQQQMAQQQQALAQQKAQGEMVQKIKQSRLKNLADKVRENNLKKQISIQVKEAVGMPVNGNGKK